MIFIAKTRLQIYACLSIASKKEGDHQLWYFPVTEKKLDSVVKNRILDVFFDFKIFNIKNKSPVRRMILEVAFLFKTLPRPNKVFIASIDDLMFRALLKKWRDVSIYTYDDGSANYIPGSFYYKEFNSNWYVNFYRALGAYQTLNVVKQSIVEHYSFCPSMNNIVNNVTNIDLHSNVFTPDDGLDYAQAGSEAIVFIGSVFNELLDTSAQDRVLNIIRSIDSKCGYFYLAHPRFNLLGWPESTKIGSGYLVCEEFIISLLSHYDNVRIFSFPTSSIYLLSDVPGIKFYVINEGINSNWTAQMKQVFSFIEDSVELVNLTELEAFFDYK